MVYMKLLQVNSQKCVAAICKDKTVKQTQREMETETEGTALKSLSALMFALSTWVGFYFSLSTASEMSKKLLWLLLCLFYQKGGECYCKCSMKTSSPSLSVFIFKIAETAEERIFPFVEIADTQIRTHFYTNTHASTVNMQKIQSS